MTDHPDPVLRMAGEMLAQFVSRPRDEAADAVAAHIRQFWDPRMRRALVAASENPASAAEFDPDIRRVASLLAD